MIHSRAERAEEHLIFDLVRESACVGVCFCVLECRKRVKIRKPSSFEVDKQRNRANGTSFTQRCLGFATVIVAATLSKMLFALQQYYN